MRLRKLQTPSRIDGLLDSLMSGLTFIPVNAYAITSREALPLNLQRIALGAERAQQSWRAWTDDRRTWLVTAEMPLAPSREHGQPVLEVRFYNDDGRLESSGTWVQNRDGRWQLTAA